MTAPVVLNYSHLLYRPETDYNRHYMTAVLTTLRDYT